MTADRDLSRGICLAINSEFKMSRLAKLVIATILPGSAFCAPALSNADVGTPTPQNMKQVVVQVCQGCHGPEVIAAKGRSRDDWSIVVERMVQVGASASDENLQAIVEYLAQNYPVGDGSRPK